MKQLTDEVFAQVRETVVNARNRLGATCMSVGGEDEAALWDQYTAQLAALDTAQPVQVNAMLVDALEQAKRWHQGDKWRDDPDNRSVWEDHMTVLNTAIAAAQQAQPERAPLTDAELRAAFSKLYPKDLGLLELAENNRDFALEAVGARHHWAAFKAGAKAIEAAHGIKQGGQHD